MQPNTEFRNLNAALDLPAGQVASAAQWSAQMPRLSVAQLIVLATRIARSQGTAAQARATTGPERMTDALDQIDARLLMMWAMVEGELERRLGGR
jgi:hypothetical protein